MKSLFLLFVAAVIIVSMGHWANAQGIEWEIYTDEVKTLYNQGQYDRAVIVAQKALQIAEHNLGSDNPALATSLHNLAVLYKAQGQTIVAEPLFKQAITIDGKSANTALTAEQSKYRLSELNKPNAGESQQRQMESQQSQLYQQPIAQQYQQQSLDAAAYDLLRQQQEQAEQQQILETQRLYAEQSFAQEQIRLQQRALDQQQQAIEQQRQTDSLNTMLYSINNLNQTLQNITPKNTSGGGYIYSPYGMRYYNYHQTEY